KPSFLAALAMFIAFNASAATLTLGVIERADDERLAPARVELAYPGHPGGPIHHAVEMALKEAQFELDAAKLRVTIELRSARSADDAKSLLQQLAKAGTAGVVLDLPAAWIAAPARSANVA